MAEKDEKTTEVTEEVEETTDAVTEDASEEESELKFAEDPTFEVDYKGDCAYEVKVTVPKANEVEQADKMFDELKNEAEVPGFRRGRAPRRLIERKFSKAVKGEVEGKLVSASFQKLIKDQDLHPIALPDVDGLDGEEERPDDAPLSFTFKFEVAPRVELGKYRGIEIERPVLKVEESDIESAIEEIRSRYAAFESIEDGKAEDGDQVVISFKGAVDGQEFPGGTANKYPYILGTKRFFPEFEDVLKGAKVGDEVTCTVKLPDNNPKEELRGKDAEFTINVMEIKRRSVPELDDEFAKKAGYEGVDDLRAKVTENLQGMAENQSNMVAEARAIAAIIKGSTFEIPKSMIENVSQDIYQDEFRQLLQMRVPLAQIQENDEEMKERSKVSAVNEIKRLTILSEVAEAEGIEVTDDDFMEEMGALAGRAGTSVEAVLDFMAEGDRRTSQENRIYRAKAMKAIMDNAKITDKEVSRDELEGEQSGTDAENA